MNLHRRNILLVAFSLCLGMMISSCKSSWDEHNAVNSPLLAEDLLKQINSNPDLSKFSEYLVKTGYDKVIASSKSFTIWAPNNAALAALDPAVINTDDKLKLFVGNHIAFQAYLSTDPKPSLRVKTLNGKLVTYTKTTVDDMPIIATDTYVGNGVLHVISKAIIPKVNAWEYLMSTTSLQKTEILSLNYNFFDITKAVQTGVDPKTGAPVYQAGTGKVVLNTYLEQKRVIGTALTTFYSNVINNEDSTYTYIILTDAAFTNEKAKLDKFYKTTKQDTTDSLSKYAVVKDLAFKGILNSDNFPADAYSTKDSVRFHLDKNAIVTTQRVSNGVVYVMSSVNYDLYSTQTDNYGKLKNITVQGEALNLVQSAKSYSTRVRRNPFTGATYTDFFISNHGVSALYVKYLVNNVLSTKYTAYWVAENDVQAATFPQKVTFLSPTATDFMAYKTVNSVVDPLIPVTPSLYAEQSLGAYTFTRFYNSPSVNQRVADPLNLFLVSNNVTTNGLNSMVLDYIKLVPTP